MSRKSLNEKKMYGKSEKWLNITWNPLNLHQITASKLPLSAISTNHKLNCMYCFALFRLVSFGLIYTSVHVCSVLYSIDIRGLKLINDPDTGRYHLLCLVSHSKDRPVTHLLSHARTHWSSDAQRPFLKHRKHSQNDLNN